MERIIMTCSNCSAELGYIDVEKVDLSFYSTYICGNCNQNLVPDPNSVIEDVVDPNEVTEENNNQEQEQQAQEE